MPDRIVTEHVWAELIRESDGQVYRIKLKLSVKEYTPDEETSPIHRILMAHEPVIGMSTVPDANDFLFREQKSRVQGNHLLAGR